MNRLERVGWLAVAIVLCVFTIPWFFWGDSTVVAGIPLWLWWHVGWMLLASVVFWLFTQRAWGIGIEPKEGDREGPGGRPEPTDGDAGGGERL